MVTSSRPNRLAAFRIVFVDASAERSPLRTHTMQNELTTYMAHKEPVKQSGLCFTDMQKP